MEITLFATDLVRTQQGKIPLLLVLMPMQLHLQMALILVQQPLDQVQKQLANTPPLLDPMLRHKTTEQQLLEPRHQPAVMHLLHLDIWPNHRAIEAKHSVPIQRQPKMQPLHWGTQPRLLPTDQSHLVVLRTPLKMPLLPLESRQRLLEFNH